MPYIQNLPKTEDRTVDFLSRDDTGETLVYIHIGGTHEKELEEALDAIYFDTSSSRDFHLVDVKRSKNLYSAMVVMLPKRSPIKF